MQQRMLKFIVKAIKLFFVALFALPFILLAAFFIILTVSNQTHEKDVSGDPKRNPIVGKEYVLLADAHLTRFSYDGFPSLEVDYPRTYKEVDGQSILNLDAYSIFETVPKGTKFRVTGIFINTDGFGCERCSQSIIASFINHEGNVIDSPIVESSHKFYVTYLFENTFQYPSENWFFNPRQTQIKKLQN